jgi:hypothetical protein
MSSNVSYFAEESCWDGEKFRSIRREVVFVVAGHAIKTGVAIRHEFRADFGLWYDYEDELLISILREEIPEINWGWYVFHKKLDHSAIHVLNPDSGKVVGSIYPRGRTRQKLSSENMAANIVPIAKGVEYRELKRRRDLEEAEKRSRRDNPE